MLEKTLESPLDCEEIKSVNPIGFELSCFHCHLFLEMFFISLLISSVILLFRSVLFNLHVFVFLTVAFFSCNWYLVSWHCGWRRCWYDFSFLKFIEVWFVTQEICGLCWRIFLVHFRRRCILLHLDEMSWRYNWDPSQIMYHLSLVFLINFLFWWSVRWCKWGVKVSYSYCVTVCFSFPVF